MIIETLDDIIEELANKLYVYGGCNDSDDGDKQCEKCLKTYTCCRVEFSRVLDERIRTAIVNEEKLNNAGL